MTYKIQTGNGIIEYKDFYDLLDKAINVLLTFETLRDNKDSIPKQYFLISKLYSEIEFVCGMLSLTKDRFKTHGDWMIKEEEWLHKRRGRLIKHAFKLYPRDSDVLMEIANIYFTSLDYIGKKFKKNGLWSKKMNSYYANKIYKMAYNLYEKSLKYATNVYQCEHIFDFFFGYYKLTRRGYLNCIKCCKKIIKLNPSLKKGIERRMRLIKKWNKEEIEENTNRFIKALKFILAKRKISYPLLKTKDYSPLTQLIFYPKTNDYSIGRSDITIVLERKGFIHIFNKKKEWKIHFDRIERYIKKYAKEEK